MVDGVVSGARTPTWLAGQGNTSGLSGLFGHKFGTCQDSLEKAWLQGGRGSCGP